MDATSALAKIPAPRAVPVTLAVDVSAGFLDRVADEAGADPTVENLLKLLPPQTLRRTAESRETPKYLATLDRVLDTLDLGSRYAGYTPDQAAVMDDITGRFGNPEVLGCPDVIAVADKYRVPALVLAGNQGASISDPGHPDHYKMLRMFASAGIKPNSSVSRMASLVGSAEDHLKKLEVKVQWGGRGTEGRIDTRLTWYDQVPYGTCPASDNRKRKRHAAAAERIMGTLRAVAEGKAGTRTESMLPWTCYEGAQRSAVILARSLTYAGSMLSILIRHGQVPEGIETEMLVADVATRAQTALATWFPAELSGAPAEAGEVTGAVPAGAIASAVATDAEAEAEELERARKVAIGAVRRKLERSPDASDRELWLTVSGKYRTPLADTRAEVIAEARAALNSLVPQ